MTGVLRARVDGEFVIVPGSPGPSGPTGPAGPTGPTGAPGAGVPTGGTTGQTLTKTSSADYATAWQTSGPAVNHTYNGTAPVAQTDAADYELGTRMEAVGAIWVVGLRVHNPGLRTSTAGLPRYGRLWTSDPSWGTQVLRRTLTFPLTLAAGWNEALFADPFLMPIGQEFVVSYGVGQWGANDYSAVAISPYDTADGQIHVGSGAGVYDLTPGTYPTTVPGGNIFYGVDVLYTTTAPLGTGVPTSRTIGTTAPLTGGGDLSADRTLAIDTFTSTVKGAVPASGGGTANYLRADGAWRPQPPMVVKSTTPTAADYGEATIPVGAVWVQSS